MPYSTTIFQHKSSQGGSWVPDVGIQVLADPRLMTPATYLHSQRAQDSRRPAKLERKPYSSSTSLLPCLLPWSLRQLPSKTERDPGNHPDLLYVLEGYFGPDGMALVSVCFVILPLCDHLYLCNSTVNGSSLLFL